MKKSYAKFSEACKVNEDDRGRRPAGLPIGEPMTGTVFALVLFRQLAPAGNLLPEPVLKLHDGRIMPDGGRLAGRQRPGDRAAFEQFLRPRGPPGDEEVRGDPPALLVEHLEHVCPLSRRRSQAVG